MYESHIERYMLAIAHESLEAFSKGAREKMSIISVELVIES